MARVVKLRLLKGPRDEEKAALEAEISMLRGQQEQRRTWHEEVVLPMLKKFDDQILAKECQLTALELEPVGWELEGETP